MAVQALEALQATEAELSTARARLAAAHEALETARQREERLLKILERRQVRFPQLIMTMAATAAITVILTLVAVHYLEMIWPSAQTRTAVIQPAHAGGSPPAQAEDHTARP